jgi:hypothetical protein
MTKEEPKQEKERGLIIQKSDSSIIKQETLEEAAENAFVIFQNENPIVPQKHILPFKLGYIEGAKWQAERMYSEEEVIEIAKQYAKRCQAPIQSTEWLLEQFKKK